MRLALLVANRGFFPSSVIDLAYDDMHQAFRKAGVECLSIDRNAIKYGAVETTQEGFVFARFLEEHRGEFDGLVICLPNFGDENGIKAAIAGCDVPILIQAYPDEIGHMDFEHRRDAFCGKFALTSVLTQMGKRYTTFTPFTVHPLSTEFDTQLQKFAAVCRVVKKMKKIRLGALGARTTAFKSVRYDEVALERHGIDVESYDFSYILKAVNKTSESDPAVKDWLEKLHSTADFSNAPVGRDVSIAKLGAVLDLLARDAALDVMAIRCWSELQETLNISPCAVVGLFNQAGIPIACEMDVTNAIAMLGLALASQKSCGCLDWNNNYGNEPDKCILFHCGPLPMELMQGPGVIEEHKMLSKTYGQGCSWGLNVGKIRTGDITFAGMRTEAGQLCFYADKARITDDPVEKEFFGVSGVLEMPGLQNKLNNISRNGFRHHVTITAGDVEETLSEALVNYLGYKRINI